ncbi:MAG: translocation/assembly module TamB domain-containing protein, partial [Owenweeksia sp.]
LRGYVNGDINVTGNTGAPKVEGELELPKVAFTVSFLQTDYNLTGSPRIKILQDRISFPDLILRDSEYASEGKISGTVTHNNFRDFDLDLRIDANELLTLNTRSSADNAYFGTAFVSGVITIKGPPDEVVIKADVSTERDTRFNIPLDAAQDVRKSDFVTFINPNDTTTKDKEKENRVKINKGITLDFNISVNRNAQVQIIIDQDAGTKLTSTGYGNIRLRIDPFQDMELYGTYTVYEGQFLFALENILRRNFRVQRGGTVIWNGDPLDALVNITAEYSTRADPSPLVSEYNGGRTLVNIYMTLSGQLLDPSITFAIEAPRASSTVQTVIGNRLSDDTKMNQQVFSLLAFNRFAPDQGLADPGSSTGREQGLKLLASRASSWINQLTGDYNVSLDYQSAGDFQNGGDATNPNEVSVNSQEEFEVGVSKRFFNDRFTVNGSVGVPVGENKNQIAGDFEIEYNITEDGRIRAKAFNRAVQDQFSFADQNYQQGVGVFYRIDFNNWSEFFYKILHPVESTQKEDREKENAREEEIPGPEEESIKEIKDQKEEEEEKDTTSTDEGPQ